MSTIVLRALFTSTIGIGILSTGLLMAKQRPLFATAGSTAFGGAAPTLELSVRPSVAFAPASAVIVAAVERQHENRGLQIEAMCDDYSSTSYRQLDGEFEARTHSFTLENLPACVYTVKATVFGVGGRLRAVDSAAIHVKP